eukprot:7758992-Pyramimonas_sp.AAC.1
MGQAAKTPVSKVEALKKALQQAEEEEEKNVPYTASQSITWAKALYSTMHTPSFITDSPYTTPWSHGSTCQAT